MVMMVTQVSLGNGFKSVFMLLGRVFLSFVSSNVSLGIISLDLCWEGYCCTRSGQYHSH